MGLLWYKTYNEMSRKTDVLLYLIPLSYNKQPYHGLRSPEVYGIEADHWTFISNMLVNRAGCGAAVV